MLQSSSPRLTASHKVAGSTSKVGKRFVGIVDPPKGSATIGFILAQLFGGFGAGPPKRDEPALNERAPAGADVSSAPIVPSRLSTTRAGISRSQRRPSAK